MWFFTTYLESLTRPEIVFFQGGSECSWDKERLTSPPAGTHSAGPGGAAGAPGGAAAGGGGGGGGGAAGGGAGRGPAIAAVNQQQLQQQQQQLLANSERTQPCIMIDIFKQTTHLDKIANTHTCTLMVCVCTCVCLKRWRYLLMYTI